MKPFPIPVVALGPGSQILEDDEPLAFMEMPRNMRTFDPPRLPEADDPAALAEAVALLRALLVQMQGWQLGQPNPPVQYLERLGADARRIVNDALGQGEVSARVLGEVELRIQETVFAGVWRVLYLDRGGRLLADTIEACAVPEAIQEQALAGASWSMPDLVTPEGVMNAPVLVAELRDVVTRFTPGDPPHVINLTLLPLTPEDIQHLVDALGVGSAVVLSRGYGNCRISSTALANTWWVQYYNASDQLILNTIEVTDMPDVVPASADDYGDSVSRLAEWIEALETV